MRVAAADHQRRLTGTRRPVFIPGADGLKPALQGMVFCLLAFVGFEAAAPLAEETRDPEADDPPGGAAVGGPHRPVLHFNMYAATVYFGPDRMRPISSGSTTATRGAGWPTRSCRRSAACWSPSRSSTARSPTPAPERTHRPGCIFSLGRVSLLPRWFAAVHETHRTPMNAVHFQGILGIGLAVVLGLAVRRASRSAAR